MSSDSAAEPPETSGSPESSATPEPPGAPATPGPSVTPDAPPAPPADPELAAVAAVLGAEAEVVRQYGRILATVPAEAWVDALTAARDGLGADFLDWLTGVDELDAGYLVAAFVAATADRGPGRLGKARGLILRTRVAKDAQQRAVLASATGVYRGAAWHERETFEMFGIEFTGHAGLKPLLLPDGFEGHPLRKDFVLASRVAKAWPGAKEPGESEHHAASPGRRRMLPPGVPGEEWLKPYAPEPAEPAAAAAPPNTGPAEDPSGDDTA
ncbi:MAG TPA: NADH-quinone oxidoreductase subunit C [Actinospica sp.]|jgi:NADH-quinone oxidoreductase subunit C|nr:NADH-quinone oxidoreductase subunit C [Actinospica sp.]